MYQRTSNRDPLCLTLTQHRRLVMLEAAEIELFQQRRDASCVDTTTREPLCKQNVISYVQRGRR